MLFAVLVGLYFLMKKANPTPTQTNSASDRITQTTKSKVVSKTAIDLLDNFNNDVQPAADMNKNVHVLLIYKPGCPYCNNLKSELMTEFGKKTYDREKGYIQLTPVSYQSKLGRLIMNKNKVTTVPFVVAYKTNTDNVITMRGQTPELSKKFVKLAFKLLNE